MLLRFDPFREIDRLAEQMVSGTRTARMVPMDVFRRGDNYLVELDLPGVDPSSVDVSIDRNTLTIRAERAPSSHEGDEVLVAERPQGAFTRQLALGDGLDAENVSADYDNGVLRLAIPVAPAAKPRRVEIKAAGPRREVLDVGSSPSADVGSAATAEPGNARSREDLVGSTR